MIDNAYELKQRFVGFNKVKLLTVVFYCMAYSWCSFLNEYNASEEENKEKGIWAVDGETIVYTDKGFKVTYTWKEGFWEFVSCGSGKNTFPAGYERASDLVDFLYRYRDAIGIKVKPEVEYKPIDRKDLPGCCTSCCKGKLGDKELFDKSTREEHSLGFRILFINRGKGKAAGDAWNQWIGDIRAIGIDPAKVSEEKKLVLFIIAKLFNQANAGNKGARELYLSGTVKGLIRKKIDNYSNVSLEYSMSLEGVIDVARVENNNK